MPEGAAPRPALPPVPFPLDRLQLRNVPTTPLRSFPQYDEEEGVRTPEPIRVVRTKKKGTGKKRKPKEVVDDSVP